MKTAIIVVIKKDRESERISICISIYSKKKKKKKRKERKIDKFESVNRVIRVVNSRFEP